MKKGNELSCCPRTSRRWVLRGDFQAAIRARSVQLLRPRSIRYVLGHWRGSSSSLVRRSTLRNRRSPKACSLADELEGRRSCHRAFLSLRLSFHARRFHKMSEAPKTRAENRAHLQSGGQAQVLVRRSQTQIGTARN